MEILQNKTFRIRKHVNQRKDVDCSNSCFSLFIDNYYVAFWHTFFFIHHTGLSICCYMLQWAFIKPCNVPIIKTKSWPSNKHYQSNSFLLTEARYFWQYSNKEECHNSASLDFLLYKWLIMFSKVWWKIQITILP